MNNRTETLLKAALLIGLGLMLYEKITSGTLGFYINARFAWLTYVGAMLFIALGLGLVGRLMSQRSAAPELSPAATRLSWPAVGLMALPLALGLLIPARPLGAGAIAAKGVGLTAPGSAGGATSLRRAQTGPKNILDWLREFSSTPDPSTLTGQPVDVTGFVYRDARNAPNQIWVSRFTISCCVADASAIGLLAQVDSSFDQKSDQWVRVTGKLGVTTFAGEKVPVILPDKIEPIPPPDQPYLYP
ncbi:MAG TPA: TIGR03943 family protein [Thermoflexales bacterium]|nr:TIGR03943 family protein [Thermoflexales bacterium]HQW35871.1 TIGR03943 family protein [Thermoflexales bacterium]HQZ23004.1 TIGR03943 family protein [Thermoflexales bacterium]HQZ99433.1 TIGR03943 family protein [Thermoflexales bacterium]